MCSYLILLNSKPFFFISVFIFSFSRGKKKGTCTWFCDFIQLGKNQCALSKDTSTSQLKPKSLQKRWIWSKELCAGKDGGRVLLEGLQLPHGLALWKRHTGIAQTCRSAKGTGGVGKGLHFLRLSTSWNGTQSKTSHHQTDTQGLSPALCISAVAHPPSRLLLPARAAMEPQNTSPLCLQGG